MKKLSLLLCAISLGFICFSQSQLFVATDKTISLIFPFPIRHVDKGSSSILVQQISEAGNVLLVKAASEKFTETNLSVLTEDGSVYSFRVNYEANPTVWVWHIPMQREVTLSTYANSILDNRPRVHNIRDKSWGMEASISGIYIRENVIYYQLHLENKSPIDYDIDFLKFYIRDNRKHRRTAIQEIELTPLYVSGNVTQVKAYGRNVVVIGLEKFTIPDAKYLAVQIMEKNGGRHLLLKVKNNRIMKAVILPDMH